METCIYIPASATQRSSIWWT